MAVITTDNIREISAQLAKEGYVVMPPPPPGYRYAPSKVVSGSSFLDEDGGVRPRKQKERKKFVKFYGEVWEALGMRKVLNPNEVYCITLLFPYCEINTNYLVEKIKGGQNRPLELDDIAKIINREQRQTKRILKSLTDKNILFHGESGGCQKYVVNPEIYWNGGDKVQYEGFKTMFYSHRDNNIRRAKEQLKEALPKKILNVNGKQTSILH
jgi:hypothetical protein